MNVQSENPIAQIIAHELTHSIEQAGAYKELSDFIFRRLQTQGMNLQRMREQKRALYERYGAALESWADIDAEIVAEYVELYLLQDEAAIMDLVKQNRTLGQRIIAWIDKILARLGSKRAKERQFC